MIGRWKNVGRNRSSNSGARRLKTTMATKGNVVPMMTKIDFENINNKNINLYRYIRFVAGLEVIELKPHLNCQEKDIPFDEICRKVLDNVEDDVKYLIETAVDSEMFDRELITLEVD